MKPSTIRLLYYINVVVNSTVVVCAPSPIHNSPVSRIKQFQQATPATNDEKLF